jgi:hypothetical protein
MPTTSKADELLRFLTGVMVDEGTVIIEPRIEPFRAMQRNFLDGIRKCPARISVKPGTDPYTAVLDRPGRWLFVWVPEK